MKLYHGSNTEVKNPVIKKTLRALDFGSGFYLTSDYFQAEKWAKTVTLRRREGIPSVNVYFFDEMKLLIVFINEPIFALLSKYLVAMPNV